MGPGKLIPWSQFEGVLQIPEVLEVLDPPSQTTPSVKSVRHRHVKKSSKRDPEATNETTSQDQDDDDSENDEASLVFPCPDEGCIKAYSHFTSLQAHLDTGKHKRLPEQETSCSTCSCVTQRSESQGRLECDLSLVFLVFFLLHAMVKISAISLTFHRRQTI